MLAFGVTAGGGSQAPAPASPAIEASVPAAAPTVQTEGDETSETELADLAWVADDLELDGLDDDDAIESILAELVSESL